MFFYPPEKIRSIFLKRKPAAQDAGTITNEGRNTLVYFFIPYFILQLILPLRHYFINGDVLWTEEGHRLSWRMMLRTRSGDTDFKIINKKTGEPLFYNFSDDLTHKQRSGMETKPDMIWQMAQRIKQHFASQNIDAAVYANTNVSVNNGPYQALIDPKTDLASVSWDYFSHCDWVLLPDNK